MRTSVLEARAGFRLCSIPHALGPLCLSTNVMLRKMNWYLRVIPTDADTELNQDTPKIVQIVSRFAGASLTKHPEWHSRGGYSLFIDCEESDQTPIIEALAEGGFRGCI